LSRWLNGFEAERSPDMRGAAAAQSGAQAPTDFGALPSSPRQLADVNGGATKAGLDAAGTQSPSAGSGPPAETAAKAGHAGLVQAVGGLVQQGRGRGRGGGQAKDDSTSGSAVSATTALPAGICPSPLSFTPTAAPAAPAASGAPVLAPVLQQLVEFATLGRNRAGDFEFRLGLRPGVLGGLQVCLCAYGHRRVGLKVRPGRMPATEVETHIGRLVDALAARNVEVVDVVCQET